MGTRRVSGIALSEQRAGGELLFPEAGSKNGKVAVMDIHEHPYEILGLGPAATEKQMKRRYRFLSRRFHPDLNPDDPKAEENFKTIQWAYQKATVRTTQRIVVDRASGDKGHADTSVDALHPFHGFFEALKAYGMRMKPKKKEEQA
jgi:DnaJ-class molecular chaperone